jgi:Flp pilus assembly protein TadD
MTNLLKHAEQDALKFMHSGNFAEARLACERIINLAPAYGPALHLLGICLIREGLPAAAIPHLQAASHALPETSAVWLNLAIARRACGDPAGAADALAEALRINPDQPSAHNNLGVIQRELKAEEEALSHFFKAVALEPENAEYLCNLATLLRDMKRGEEALPYYRRAMAHGLDKAEIHHSMATILVSLNQQEEALHHFQRSLELFENNAQAHHALGNLLTTLGKFDEAEVHFRRAIMIKPEKTESYRQLVHMHPIARTDKDLATQIETLLDNTTLTDPATADLHFALGKYHDSRAEYDDAFKHYRSANALMRKEVKFDRNEFKERIDALIATFTSNLFAEHCSTNNSQRAVIICGLPRSGTTLTEQILASHPSVYGAGELTFWGDQEHKLQDESLANNSKYPESVTHLKKNQFNAFGEAYLATLNELAKPESTYITDKMPGNFLHLGLIHLALPHAKVIYCNRHPLDNAISIFFLRFGGLHPYAYDLDDLAFYIGEHHRLLQHWRNVFSKEQFLEIQYEDTVVDLERTARTLISFIGLPWDERCLDFHNTKRPIRTASQWQVRQPIYDSSVGRWKNYQSYLGPLSKFMQS